MTLVAFGLASCAGGFVGSFAGYFAARAVGALVVRQTMRRLDRELRARRPTPTAGAVPEAAAPESDCG